MFHHCDKEYLDVHLVSATEQGGRADRRPDSEAVQVERSEEH